VGAKAIKSASAGLSIMMAMLPGLPAGITL
jgi:hypothetical protein